MNGKQNLHLFCQLIAFTEGYSTVTSASGYRRVGNAGPCVPESGSINDVHSSVSTRLNVPLHNQAYRLIPGNKCQSIEVPDGALLTIMEEHTCLSIATGSCW